MGSYYALTGFAIDCVEPKRLPGELVDEDSQSFLRIIYYVFRYTSVNETKKVPIPSKVFGTSCLSLVAEGGIKEGP